MELTYKLGSAQGFMNNADHVFKTLNYLENGIRTHYQSVGVGDGDHITLKVGGITMHMSAMDIAAQLKVPYRSPQDRLEDDRKLAADRHFGNYDFGDYIVSETASWSSSRGGLLWERAVFFENPDGGNSIRGEFFIVFKKDSAEVEDDGYST